MTDLPIETLKNGRYTIESVLGAGGMSVVFKALDTRIGVHRAIKLLHPKFARNGSIRERFENEAYAQAGLRHPNILMVHDVVEEDIGVYLVMEMAEQGSLSGRVKSLGPMSPQEVAQVGMTMASALSVAHAEGVIHRDIKPENILVDRLGNLKLADFGIARVVARQHELTRTGTVMGTWAYMPPEQRDSAKLVDARSDIYALGASLYFLSTGRQPFDLHNTEAHAQAFADFPLALAAVIQKATRFSADDRYDSCDQLRAELAVVVEGLPTEPFVDFDPPTVPPETQVPDLGDLSTYIVAAQAAARGATAVPDPGQGAEHGTSTFVLDDSLGELPSSPDHPAAGGLTAVPPAQAAPSPAPAGPSASGSGPTIVADIDEPDAAPVPSAEGPTTTRSGIHGSQLMIFVAGILAAVLAVVILLPRLIAPKDIAPKEADPAVDASLGAMAEVQPAKPPADPPPEDAPVGNDEEALLAEEAQQHEPSTAAQQSSTTAAAATTSTGSDKAQPRVITIQPLAKADPTAADPDELGSPLAEPTGTVVVETVPSGATVRLNGAVLSKTGRGYELPVGNHLLEIQSTGGEVHKAPVSVMRDRTIEICYSFDTNSACSP